MSRRFNIFALENDETSEEVVEVLSPKEAEEAEEEVSEELEEHLEETDDLEEGTDKLDKLQNVTEILDESVENEEGLDGTGAKLLEVAIESIMGKSSKVFIKKNMPALESYGSTNSRVMTTRLASEKLKDSIMAGINKAIEWLKDMWNRISDYFSKVFKTSYGIVLSAKESLSKVSELKGEASAKELKDDALINDYSYIGEVSIESITTNINEQVKLFNKFIELISKATDNIYDNKRISEFTGNGDLYTTTKETYKSLSSIFDGFDVNKEGKYETKPFIQGKYFSAKASNSGVVIDIETKEKKESAQKTVPTLTPIEIEKALKLSISIGEENKKLESETKDTKKYIKSLEKVLNGYSKKLNELEKSAKEEDKANFSKTNADFNKVKSLLITTMNNYRRVASSAPALNIKAQKDLYNYAVASMKQYGLEKPTTSEEPKK